MKTCLLPHTVLDLLYDSLDDDLRELREDMDPVLLIGLQALRHLNAIEAAVTNMDQEGVSIYARGVD